MNIVNSIFIFLFYCLIPYFSPGIVNNLSITLQSGMFGYMFLSYFVPFVMNWFVTFASDYMYLNNSCKEDKTPNFTTVFWLALIPPIIALILSAVLNFIPVLKTPLLVFTVFGGMWMVDVATNIIAIYLIAAPITWTMRSKIC